MKSCPSCGVEGEFTFCPRCGTGCEPKGGSSSWSVVVGEELPPVAELLGRAVAAPEDSLQCRRCRATLRPGARFCGHCGEKFE